MGAAKVDNLDRGITAIPAGQHQVLRLEVGVDHVDAMQKRQGRRRLADHPGGIGLAVAAVVGQVLEQFASLHQIQHEVEVIVARRIEVLVYRSNGRMAPVSLQKQQIFHLPLERHVVGQPLGNLLDGDGLAGLTIDAAVDGAELAPAEGRDGEVDVVHLLDGMDVGRLVQQFQRRLAAEGDGPAEALSIYGGDAAVGIFVLSVGSIGTSAAARR
mmetsp:Transcript_26627/g.62343  ORF Transcript_26627/g.62343 Transcript_26627/m.62343 type:complete len:214 (+) Transcript_26627:1708-2349(+)